MRAAQKDNKRKVKAIQRGRPLKEAIQRANPSTTEIKDIKEFIKQPGQRPRGDFQPYLLPDPKADPNYIDTEELILPKNDESTSCGKSRSQILKVAAKFIRTLKQDAAAYCDGIHNAFIDLLLTSEPAMEAAVKLALALGSDAVLKSKRQLSLKLAKRSRGGSIEKPNKPGKYRTIDIGTWIITYTAA